MQRMQKENKSSKPNARLPRGFEDRGAGVCVRTAQMVETIRAVYASYGFETLETPFVEYAEMLGKFLPDQDRPNAGVFAFQDDDEQWLSLRYDLTAPLARFVAENYDHLPKPYRSMRAGYVFRNEKPGPGRFRQFMQVDADTVGTASALSDAEVCMMVADAMEALGLARGQYTVKVNNRQILDCLLESLGLGGEDNAARRLIIMRALDKVDRLGLDGARLLLGAGRKDESGDFTKGAELSEAQIAAILAPLAEAQNRAIPDELSDFFRIARASGYEADKIAYDPTIVRGLEYYTGAVFEVELNLITRDEKGNPVRFGAVGGGGRYDGLVSRFRAEPVPATGISIGVSRLLAALSLARPETVREPQGPVVVLTLDAGFEAESFELARQLRQAGIAAEPYTGTSGMKAQMKYADKRNAPVAVIVGSNEREAGQVTLKDLAAGKRAAQNIESHDAWREAKAGQLTVPRAEFVASVQAMLRGEGGQA